MGIIRFLVIVVPFSAIIWHSAFAQIPDLQTSQYSPAAYYRYVEPGEVTMLVKVWGTVRNPGLYEVPVGTRLTTILSVAGGPAITSRNRGERRSILIGLTRPDDTGGSVIFETVMEDGALANIEDPMLQSGDIISVDTVTRQRFSWQNALPIVSALSSVGLVIFYFLQL
jgi:hypothetical protein